MQQWFLIAVIVTSISVSGVETRETVVVPDMTHLYCMGRAASLNRFAFTKFAKCLPMDSMAV